MRLIICVVLPLVAWCAPAASVVKDGAVGAESLRPLIRTKRADEEIVFGNHQNEARVVKKADPSLKLLKDDSVIENNLDTDQLDNGNGNGMDVDGLFSNDAKNLADLTEEEQIQDGGNQDSIGGFLSNPASLPEVEGSGEIPMNEANMENDLHYKDYPDNRDYYDYFYPNSMYGRYRRNTKDKRAAPQQMLTADTMTDSVAMERDDKNQRHKRDLSTDELAQWLESGDMERGNEPEPSRYYPEYDQETEIDTSDPWERLAMEELMEKEYPEAADTSADYPAYEEYPDESLEPVEEDPERNRELLSLMEYLEGEAPVEEPQDVPAMYPEDVQDQWQDLGLDPDVPYEPIVYNGVSGIFIPMDGKESTPVMQKRQYLSLVPGVRKRDFSYPYNMEPEGGRWDAFVSPQEKRTADAYERLYRLAEALNAGYK